MFKLEITGKGFQPTRPRSIYPRISPVTGLWRWAKIATSLMLKRDPRSRLPDY